jgi:hypothetical protein
VEQSPLRPTPPRFFELTRTPILESRPELRAQYFVLSRWGGSGAALGSGVTVLLEVGLDRFFGVTPGMTYMAHRHVSMVSCCFVVASLVMLGRFLMMACRMRQVL